MLSDVMVFTTKCFGGRAECIIIMRMVEITEMLIYGEYSRNVEDGGMDTPITNPHGGKN